jgi:hypothetical protein
MDLIQAMQTEYSRCKRWLYLWALPITIGLFVAAVIGSFPIAEWATSVLAIGVFVGQVLIFFLRYSAGDHQSRAEEIRRMAMMQDGLGIHPSPFTLARLQDRIGDLTHSEHPFLGPYYGSKEPPGPRRLLDITAECAFFTGGNARRMWNILFALAAGGLLVVLSALFTTLLFAGSTAAMQIAGKTALIVIAAWAFGDFASMACAFKELSESADRVLDGCEQALQGATAGDAASSSALALFSEYNCAVVKAPPIPGWIYRRYQDRMNTAWRTHHQARTSGPAAAAPTPAQSSGQQ